MHYNRYTTACCRVIFLSKSNHFRRLWDVYRLNKPGRIMSSTISRMERTSLLPALHISPLVQPGLARLRVRVDQWDQLHLPVLARPVKNKRDHSQAIAFG